MKVKVNWTDYDHKSHSFISEISDDEIYDYGDIFDLVELEILKRVVADCTWNEVKEN